MDVNRAAIEESSKWNRYGQDTPYGSVEWLDKDDPMKARQVVRLDPFGQQLKEQGEADVLRRYGDYSAGYTPFSYEGLRDVDPVSDESTQRLEQATYDRAMNLLRPEYERQQSGLESRLATQGLPIGSEAYGQEMDRFQRGRSEAELAAALDAVRAGRQEQSRLFGLQSSDRARQVQEMLTGRAQPFNELASILSTTRGITAPRPAETAQMQMSPADLMGTEALKYQGAMNKYNQQMANQQAKKSGTSDAGSALAAAAIMSSDRRLKENIRHIGKFKEHNLYSYNYIGDNASRIGVMADEVRLVNPNAVIAMDNGFDAVDYARL